jgi:hypothetical protein
MLCFAGIIHLLVEETNRYYHQNLDRLLEDGPSPRPDVTDSEMYTSPSEVHRSTSCCVIGDISIRGGLSTALADFL